MWARDLSKKKKKDVGTSLKQKHENDLIATQTKFPRSVVSFPIIARNCHLEDSQKSKTLPMESLTKLFLAYRPEKDEIPNPVTTTSSSDDLLPSVQDRLIGNIWRRVTSGSIQCEEAKLRLNLLLCHLPPLPTAALIHILSLPEKQGTATIWVMTSETCELDWGWEWSSSPLSSSSNSSSSRTCSKNVFF